MVWSIENCKASVLFVQLAFPMNYRAVEREPKFQALAPPSKRFVLLSSKTVWVLAPQPWSKLEFGEPTSNLFLRYHEHRQLLLPNTVKFDSIKAIKMFSA